MKRILIVISILILIIGCTSCSSEPQSSDLSPSENYMENITQIEKNKNFEVNAVCKNDILSNYSFVVYDNNGNKIDSGNLEHIEPKFTYLNETVAKKTISYGTTNANEVTYYDLKKSVASPVYTDVYCDNSDIVICIKSVNDSSYLLVQSIFSGETLLKQDIDTGDVFVTDFDVNINGDVIKVNHSKGVDYTTVTDTFYLK